MSRLFAALLALLFASAAVAASMEEDVQRYLAIFQGNDAAAHNKAVEELAWMGLYDERLFDLLEQKILAEAAAVAGDRDQKNRVARYIRALGFSGQDKYVPTLKRFVKDMTYDRYAREALDQQPQYKRWNPIISSRASFDPKLSDDDNRVMNMLRSDDLLLMRIAAKRAYFAPDERTLWVIAEQVEKHYMTATPAEVDSVSWMVKALSKTTSHDKLLEEVKRGAPERKVRNSADSALRHAR